MTDQEQIFAGVICFIRGSIFKSHLRFISAATEAEALQMLNRIALCLYPEIKVGDIIGRSAHVITKEQLQSLINGSGSLYSATECELHEEPVVIDEEWPETIDR